MENVIRKTKSNNSIYNFVIIENKNDNVKHNYPIINYENSNNTYKANNRKELLSPIHSKSYILKDKSFKEGSLTDLRDTPIKKHTINSSVPIMYFNVNNIINISEASNNNAPNYISEQNKNEESTIEKNLGRNYLEESVYNVNNKQPALLVLKENDLSKIYKQNSICKSDSSNQLLCRICYEGNTLEKGNLIYPCLCIGSIKFIHETCLKKWIENNIISNDRKVRPECELCKHKYIMKFTSEFKFSKTKFWNMMKSLAAMIIVASIILTLIFTVIYVVVTSLVSLSDEGRKNFINILVCIGCTIMIMLILFSFKNCKLNYYDKYIKDWKIFNLDDEINLKEGEILFPNNEGYNLQDNNNENYLHENNQNDNNENRFQEGFNFMPIINPNIQVSNI